MWRPDKRGSVDVLKQYLNHKPGPEAVAKIEKLRRAFSDLHELIADAAPNSREKSIAFTSLEDASMWAVRSIVLNDPDSVPIPV